MHICILHTLGLARRLFQSWEELGVYYLATTFILRENEVSKTFPTRLANHVDVFRRIGEIGLVFLRELRCIWRVYHVLDAAFDPLKALALGRY